MQAAFFPDVFFSFSYRVILFFFSPFSSITLSVETLVNVSFFPQLPSKLYFSFTHLVCRTAEATDAQKDREDLSHPIHSDNCNLLEDGTCIYSYPAFTWRDFR